MANFEIPISPKSIASLIAGTLASLNSSACITVPILKSKFYKSNESSELQKKGA
jgi:hypothetical protein